MQKRERQRLSRIRQSLRKLAGEIVDVVDVFMEGEPMVKGTVYQQRRKCGKPNCICTRGQLHESMMLSWSQDGRTRLKAIAKGDVQEVRILTERYRRFRAARARLGRVYKNMVELIDELEQLRRQEP